VERPILSNVSSIIERMRPTVSGAVPSKEARVAAAWWADWLRPDPAPAHVGGDFRSMDPAFAVSEVMRQAERSSAGFSAKAIVDFEQALAQGIDRERAKRNGNLVVGVDYDPDELLVEAGEAAGINVRTIFPWKTKMLVAPGSVTVGEGRGLDRRLIELLEPPAPPELSL
jgi:hypothetical protein